MACSLAKLFGKLHLVVPIHACKCDMIKLGREVVLGAHARMLLSWEVALGGAQPHELAK